jgi:DNA polymerase I-like protein with 3'-5' exonuclease and polymerase domains
MKAFLKSLTESGAQLWRNGDQVHLTNATQEQQQRLADLYPEVLGAVIAKVTDEQRVQVTELLQHHQIAVITDNEAAAAAITTILSSSPEVIAIDTETEVMPGFIVPIPIAITKTGTISKRQPKTGDAGRALRHTTARVRLLQVYAGGPTIYLFDMRHVDWSTVAPVLTTAPIAMHNAVFDVKMIVASGGPEPTHRIFDTMTAMRLVNGTRPSMADAAKYLLDINLPKTLGASDWHVDNLTQDQLEYAALDPVVTLELHLAQMDLFDDVDHNAQEIVDEAIVAVARMELAGLPVDEAKHAEMVVQWKQDLTESLKKLSAYIPSVAAKKLPTNGEVVSYLKSVLSQEQQEAWPKTAKGGALAVSKDVLKIHGSDIPGISELLVARQWAKAISTYGDTLAAKTENGKLFGSFMIAGARSGRASSSSPNIQNLPKRSRLMAEFRSIFAAPPGHVIISADYSQIELRALAAVTGDEVMREIYRKFGQYHRTPEKAAEFDLHMATAKSYSVGDVPTKEERSIAKAINFATAYGSGARGIRDFAESAYGVRMEVEDAQAKLDAFRQTYPSVFEWQLEQARQSREDGYVMTLGGRKWHWKWRAIDFDSEKLDELEDWQIDDAIEGFHRNYALNHPIQGTCAEIMWVALAMLDQALRPWNARIVAVVHDEIVVLSDSDPQIIKNVMSITRRKMTRAWLEFFPDAPFRGLVDCHAAPTWAEAH